MGSHKNGGNFLVMRRSVPVITSNYLHSGGVGVVPVTGFWGKVAPLEITSGDEC